MARVGLYFDGFNLYHSLDDIARAAPRHPLAGSKNHLKWMCYAKLSRMLVTARSEQIEFIKVFTALAEHLPPSAARHRKAIAAWKEAPGVEVILGRFKRKYIDCKLCYGQFSKPEEKESDVNLGAHLVLDAALDRIDVAYIISGDSDMAGAARLVVANCPRVQLVAVSVPGRRRCRELDHICHRQTEIVERMVANARLDETIFSATGKVVTVCPNEYRIPI